MIFRTIKDDITGANKSIGLFGKSLNDVKNIIYSFQTNGIKNTLFNTPLGNIDTKAIEAYNLAIKTSVPYEQALAIARRTTNAETIALIESSYGAEVQTEKVTAAQKASTIATKAHSAVLKAASIAANVAISALVIGGIKLVDKLITTKRNVYNSLTDDDIYYYDEALEKVKMNYLYIENNPTRML